MSFWDSLKNNLEAVKSGFESSMNGKTGNSMRNNVTTLSYEKNNRRRTDDELSKNTKGINKRPSDYSIARGVSLSSAKSSAPSQEGVYVLYLNGTVMKCGRAAYGQGLKWRFTQYYNLNYDAKAQKGDHWAVNEKNRNSVIVSWQACPPSKCKELEAKLFRKYGKGPWGLRAPSDCYDDTWDLLI